MKDTQKTTTQTAQPWGEMVPHLRNIMSGAGGLYKGGKSTVGPQSSQTLQGNAIGTNLALRGDPNMGAAQEALGGILTGQGPVGVNPYLQRQLDDSDQQITDRVRSLYSGAGRYGSATMNRDLTDRLAANRNSALLQNYDTERGFQLSGLGMAPTIGAMRFGDSNMLAQIGASEDARKQMLTDDPWTRLQRYAGMIAGTGGGYPSQTTVQPGPSVLSQILGGVVGLGGMLGRFG